ncbi:hypothetical protein [uncultured Methanoregula sp.]|uniref:hypothetical protein n=1 Tax=uncultured Methanoregula sp. TaxID=1005933 RepID=UPI002AAA933B|nr:hypothetical protein [uncultured Methanoregula sp.]
MTSCTPRNHGLVFLIVLVVCLILDYATSDALSFVDLVQTASVTIVPVIRLENIISFLTTLSLLLGIIGFLFLSQLRFIQILSIAAILSTISLFLNVAGLLRTLIDHQVNPELLLGAAAIVYVSNVLVFTVWYWLLDFESQQDRSARTAKPVLVFPQNAASYSGYEGWTPGLVDYLFLSFHTSSTVGPTDTLVLSKNAKVAMICQVTVSLIVLVVLAARAIGILR